MAKEFGSKCDMISGSFDEVSRNCIWREHVTKETRGLKLNTDFRISDPERMQVVTEKPNYVVPTYQLDPETIRKCTEKLDTLCSTRERNVPPKEKYILPVTSAHVYGFWNDKSMGSTTNMFDHKRHKADVSKYADSYITMTGKSPFSRAQDFAAPS